MDEIKRIANHGTGFESCPGGGKKPRKTRMNLEFGPRKRPQLEGRCYKCRKWFGVY